MSKRRLFIDIDCKAKECGRCWFVRNNVTEFTCYLFQQNLSGLAMMRKYRCLECLKREVK